MSTRQVQALGAIPCPCEASQLGSQHVELAAWRGWVEAVLDQPAGRLQASQRPPRADHVADAQGRALVVGDDDLDLLHTGHCRGMTTDVATGLSMQPAAGS